MGKILWGEILVMTSASARPLVRTDCRGEGGEAGGQSLDLDGNVRAIFLGGKSRGSVAFGKPRFSGGKAYK